MNTPNQEQINHIKQIFEQKTGAHVIQKRARRPMQMAMAVAAVLACCLSLTAFAYSTFSSLSGDDLSFAAQYRGNGLVCIEVENKSDKILRFQEAVKLMRWSTAEEIAPSSDEIVFQDREIAPNTTGTMTIDLSQAYDMDLLEQPLQGDHYYLVLTNNHFLFGQDWMCTVYFSEPLATKEPLVPPAQPDSAIIPGIAEELQEYFEEISFEINARRAMQADYVQAYTQLFERLDGTVAASVSPLAFRLEEPTDVCFDASVAMEAQPLLIGAHDLSSDCNFKLLATESETALVISALLPQKGDVSADGGVAIPLFYVFAYEKEAIASEADYVFLYGRFISVAELAQYQIYEDEQYVCYEVSSLIYSDFDSYVQRFVEQNPDIRFDAQAQSRVQNIYDYYQNSLGELLARR